MTTFSKEKVTENKVDTDSCYIFACCVVMLWLFDDTLENYFGKLLVFNLQGQMYSSEAQIAQPNSMQKKECHEKLDMFHINIQFCIFQFSTIPAR